MPLSFYPLVPVWLLLALAALSAGAVLYAFRHRNPAVAPRAHRLLLALRLLAVACVTLMLLCPGRVTEDRNLERSHLVFLLDRSASMATRDLPHGQSRLAQAAAFLARHRFKRLADYPVSYYAFNARAERRDAPDGLAALAPEGGTDFREALAQADRDIGLARTAAVVLLTDGLDTSGFKGSELAVPLLCVRAGTDLAQARDLGIEPFTCPDKLNAGEALVLEIPLLLQGYTQAREVPFEVALDGRVIHAAAPTLTPGRVHTETVRLTLEQTGVHVLRLACPAFPDEVSPLNNTRELAVEVVQAKDEVAAYFPLLNNSFRPLLREFQKDDARTFTAVYRVSADTFRVRGNAVNPAFANGLPASADALRDVTCLILGAHNGELLSPAEALVLEQYVSRGGALVCLGGADSFGRLPADATLARLLPVVTLENGFRTGAFSVSLDPSADAAFADQLRQLLAENAGAPEFVLTGLNQVRDLKAGAQTLLWAEGDARLPLLVWHPYGRGKVVAVLSNTFHLWGAPEKRDANFGRLWRQLAAFAKNLDDDADLLKVALPKTELAADERVTVTALARHPAGTNRAVTVQAELFAPAGDAPLESLTFERKAECHLAELPGLKPGRYVLRVSSHDGQELLRTRYKLLLVGDALAENARLRSDRETFRAFCGDRHLFGLDEAARLEDALRDCVRKNVTLRETFLIFENPAFFLAAVGLLLAEWFLRRRFNLF